MFTLPALRGPRPSSAPRGFSLIELGIVIGVIAVLSAVFIASKGYLTAAKKHSCIQLVESLRTAAQAYAMRHHNGVAYGKGGAAKDSVSFGRLMADGFLPTPTKTPWDSMQITVDPDNGVRCSSLGGRDCARKCVGFACIYIAFPIEDRLTCEDLARENGPEAGGIAARCLNFARLELVTR